MNQKQHIEYLKNRDLKRKNISDQVQHLYESYIKASDSSSIIPEELLLLLDTYCGAWVAKQLHSSTVFSLQFLEDIYQEAHKTICQTLIKDRTRQNVRENFANYCFCIYKNKTMDHFRKSSKTKRHISSSEVNSNPDGQESIRISIQGTVPGADKDLEFSEDRKFYKQLFLYYCTALVTSPAYPPRCLALYYARILPHFWQTINPAVASSAKWAYQKMRNKTVQVLSNASQYFLQTKINQELLWCSEFIRQLEETTVNLPDSEQTCLLRDLIYTSAYTMPKIEDWSESMHKAAIKSACKLIRKDSDFSRQLRQEYRDTGSKLLEHFIRRDKNAALK